MESIQFSCQPIQVMIPDMIHMKQPAKLGSGPTMKWKCGSTKHDPNHQSAL
ncbi:conserved hypothetical protein [Ricinus communis]|uniref:Uncharacterized protein n=1 Tax=Ricinus communis TaxID=3988 RepID=B9RHA5_RICCO|nr:conserved hypothetical protein [Ricinus communis]